MSQKYDAIIAKTHIAEYSLHKYWARKPHNVLSYFISEIVPIGGKVLDPFCGSGVALRESQKLGIDAIGFDVNPIANLITKVLIDPPTDKEFSKVILPLLDKFSGKISSKYNINEVPIKYVVHETVVVCPECNKEISSSDAKKNGRSRKCPNCGCVLRFNLETLVKTKVSGICLQGQKTLVVDKIALEMQNELSSKKVFEISNEYNYKFETNRRILAFCGMETKDLFTERNYSILCNIADEFSRISDEKVKRAAFLLLTASVAQCSRLIPTRNNLSTGGPAWSVPGFWVPAEHLETNPVNHLIARYKKFVKGLHELNNTHPNCNSEVLKTDAIQGMQKMKADGNKVDLVFFDPPYGDSVPYLEFSAIWNSFLKDFPKADLDISVSDRRPKTEAWDSYYNSLDKVLLGIQEVLKPSGKLLITFNNNDERAWKALINALQKNKFVCEFVTYQIPAVISSKAQFSIEGSYISDIYSLYSYQPDAQPTRALEYVTNALIKCATARKGVIAKNLANRVAIIEWLKNNISVDLLTEKNILIKNLFDEDKGKLIYKGEIPQNAFDIEKSSCQLAKEILNIGPCEWNELYKTVASQFSEYGFLDASELRVYLDGHVVFENKRCLSYIN